MAQLFFKYGTMNSSKSAQLIMAAHNYEQQGKETMIMTSSIDTRSKVGKVESRVGISADAIRIGSEDDPKELMITHTEKNGATKYPACILVDEAQFLTTTQVQSLAKIVDSYGIPVLCFGLKTDFMGKLFEGSKALLELADKIEEIKTVCHFCNRKATMNLRLVDGDPVYDGAQIQIGDQEYLSVCRKCYYSPINR